MDRYSESLVSLQGCAMTTAKPAPFLPRDEPAPGHFTSPSRQLAEAPQRWQQRNQGLAPFQTDRCLSCRSTTRKRSNGLRERGLIQGHQAAGGACLIPSREEAFSTSPSSLTMLVLLSTSCHLPRSTQRGKGPTASMGCPAGHNQKVPEAIHQEPGEL